MFQSIITACGYLFITSVLITFGVLLHMEYKQRKQKKRDKAMEVDVEKIDKIVVKHAIRPRNVQLN